MRKRNPPEDIDPKREDVVTAPRRRRLRAKVDPPADLVANKAKLVARAKARPFSPGIMYELGENGQFQATSRHNDLDLWELMLADALGTRSESVMVTFIGDLRRLCGNAWDEHSGQWKPDERALNAALAMVGDIRPTNTVEAALAAQMVAVYMMQIRLSASALNNGGMVMERDAALAGKLARTYAQLALALQALRGKKRTARQSIKISRESHHHQHIHVTRGEPDFQRQSHERNDRATDECATLRRPHEGANILPLPRNPRAR